ncbi:hypothetical protein JST97_19840 [bacterium]|nr:hypothetical protein [bacterium]
MDPVRNLLAEAQFDSGGCFTLDFAASRKRWEQQALGDPAAFLRLTLQALVARGCDTIRVQSDPQRCTLNWEPEPLSKAELTQLSEYFQGQSDSYSSPCLQLLKLAGMLTSCRPDLRLCLVGLNWVLWLDHHQGARLEKSTGQPPGIEFCRLDRRPTDQLSSVYSVDLLHPRTSSAWPEIGLLARGFGDLPTHITWNGKKNSSDLMQRNWDDNLFICEIVRCAIVHPDAERNRLRLRWTSRNPMEALFGPHFLCCTDPEGSPIPARAGQTVQCCAAALVYNRNVVQGKSNSPSHCFRWMLNGWPVDQPQLGAPNMRVVADASDLPTDITGARLVQGEKLRARTSEMGRWLANNLACAGLQISQRTGWIPMWFWDHDRQVIDARLHFESMSNRA